MLGRIARAKNMSFRKILKKYFSMLLILTVLISLLIGIMLLLQIRFQRNDIMLQSKSLAKKTASEMDAKLFSVRDLSISTAADERVLKFLRTDRNALTKSLITRLQDVQSQIRTILNVTPILDEMILYFESDKFIVSQFSGKRYDPALHFRNSVVYHDIAYSIYPLENNWIEQSGILTYYQPILDAHGRKGALLAFISNKNLKREMGKVLPLPDAKMLIFDENERIIAETSEGSNYDYLMKNGLYKQNGKYYSVIKVPSAVNGWQYAIIMDQSDYTQSMRASVTIGIISFTFALAVSFFTAYMLAIRFCRPYETILELLKMPTLVTKEEYERNYSKIDELGLISTLIHQNKYKNLALQDELTQRERMLTSAQNAVLQAQMNPHFLFNTLESINWMVIEKLSEDNEITGMISRLAQLLRISMRTHQPLVSIEEEVEHAKLYVDLQKQRFQDRLTVEWDIDPELYEFTTVRLSLQPLIENAIRHGMKAKKEGYTRIVVKGEENHIRFEVHDNGKGILPEELEKLRIRMSAQPFSIDDRIGIVNLCNRLRLLFGERAKLEVFSVPGVDTCFSMRVPKLYANDSQDYLKNLHSEEKR